MAHYKKSNKSKKTFLNKGIKSIQKNTKKFAPKIKSGLENLGSNIINNTVPQARRFFTMMGVKKTKKYSKKQKTRKRS